MAKMGLDLVRAVLRENQHHFLTAGQIARRAGVKPTTVHFWANKESFPKELFTVSDFLGRGIKVYHEQDVTDWLQKTDRTEYWRNMLKG